MVRDPVCGCEVDDKSSAHYVSYKKRIFHFCSPYCKISFMREPEKFFDKEISNKKEEGIRDIMKNNQQIFVG